MGRWQKALSSFLSLPTELRPDVVGFNAVIRALELWREWGSKTEKIGFGYIGNYGYYGRLC